jgi:hypothetical protein
MNVVMVHPVHGAKVATNQLELEADEKNGWTRYNPDTPAEKVAAPEPVAEAPKRTTRRKVSEQPIEQPNDEKSVSDESEGN